MPYVPRSLVRITELVLLDRASARTFISPGVLLDVSVEGRLTKRADSGQDAHVEYGDWVQRLVEAARSGLVLDLAPSVALDFSRGAAWPELQQLPGGALRAALLTPDLAADPRGLRIRGANITGDLDLTHARLSYPLGLVECRLDQALSWSNLVVEALILHRCTIRSLDLDGAEVRGDLFADSLIAQGGISADGAAVGGVISLKGANLINENGDALSLDRAQVRGSLYADSLVTRGRVRARGFTLDGVLSLEGAKLTNNSGDALSLDRAQVRGGLFADSLTTLGGFRAVGATVGAQLSLKGANLTNKGGDALSFDGAEVKGGLFADSLTTLGGVRGIGARVGGVLSLKGANLTNTGGDALTLDRAELPGSLFADSVTSQGTVRARGASIGGQLSLKNADLANEGGTALDLVSASVGNLLLHPTKVAGLVDLTAARIDRLSTSRQWMGAATVTMPGWRLRDIHGILRHDPKAAARWLSTSPGDPVAQPWQELANVYDRNGQPADARWIRVRVAWRTTRVAPWPTRVLRTSYGILTGHGYHPLRAAGWLMVAALITYFIVTTQAAGFIPSPTGRAAYAASTPGAAATPSPPPTGATPCRQLANPATCFRPELYALDNVLPGTLATGQASDWRAVHPSWLPWALVCLKLFGWAMVAILLAGITGLLRRT